RYDLDFALLRVYEDGRPLTTDHYLRLSAKGAKAGDLSFVSGHPGGTQRQLTVAQLEYERDVAMPESLLRLAEVRGVLTEFQRRAPARRRIPLSTLSGAENSSKAPKGRSQALLAPHLFGAKVAAEKALRAKLGRNPATRAKYEAAFEAIAGATHELMS